MAETIIGIHDGHDSSLALLVDGNLNVAVQEERFTNRKNECGFPYNAAKWLMQNYDLSSAPCIVMGSGHFTPALIKLKRETNFSISDWIKEQHEYWKKKLIEGEDVNYYEIFSNNPEFDYDQHYDYGDILLGKYNDAEEKMRFTFRRKKFISDFFDINESKVIIADHEKIHQHYALYASPFRNEKIGIVTCEGYGNYSNATVSIYENNAIREIITMKENFLAHIYRYTTLILGMKPHEHEYKVMGLAPYAKDVDIKRILPIFEDLLQVDGMVVKWARKPPDLYFTLRERLEGKRFDHIAGALQSFLENMLCKWFSAIVKQVGVTKFVFAGGVAQNIKACKAIAELDEVEDLFIAPAAGDTSLSIGAVYYGYLTVKNKCRMNESAPLSPLKVVALGTCFSDRECKQTIKGYRLENKYRIINDVENDFLAKLLEEGLIIARFNGRIEFGLRALGNRSILADPRDFDVVRKINEKIKNRDFWMPFSPTILDSYEKRYIVNPKGLKSEFMTMAYETTDEGRKVLKAAMHPADLTLRPQILTQRANSDYYDLISCFARETGVGALLNTSFNLHGFPIVGSVDKAIETFENSELDGLILESSLILRK